MGFLLASSATGSVLAQSPIEVTAIGDQAEEVPFRQPLVEEGSSDAMEDLYAQQLLQREVQELRGTIEELTRDLDEIKARQADRYQDLDRRLEDLRLVLNEGRNEGRIATSPPRETLSTSPAADQDSAQNVDIKGEKALYDTALELIRNRQYEAAVEQLQVVIAHYPEGSYAPNSYYWLGEVYAAMPEPQYEKARQALAQVISFFPDNRKVPDAAFKLGKVYHLMGDCDRATELLNSVVQQYQTKAVAKLAESYLKDKVDCEARGTSGTP
jgi:tol-pal system protein YbgF